VFCTAVAWYRFVRFSADENTLTTLGCWLSGSTSYAACRARCWPTGWGCLKSEVVAHVVVRSWTTCASPPTPLPV